MGLPEEVEVEMVVMVVEEFQKETNLVVVLEVVGEVDAYLLVLEGVEVAFQTSKQVEEVEPLTWT